jgi:hypothetical protein
MELMTLYKTKPKDLLAKIMGQMEKLDEISLEKKKAQLKREGDKKEAGKTERKLKAKAQGHKTKQMHEKLMASQLSSPRFTEPLRKDMTADLNRTVGGSNKNVMRSNILKSNLGSTTKHRK